ncbi:N-acetylmuramoyl-L-alanine amidase [bacterium]|nr:N-acetylmuramoyl-L-alanine amidase [bacterium]
MPPPRRHVLILLLPFLLPFLLAAASITPPPHTAHPTGANLDAHEPPVAPPPVRSFPIFGSAYADVEVRDHRLRGAVYYIVSGHGGPDSGARGKRNGKTLCEDEYAYDVALRLARNLLSHDAKVYIITRDENDGIRDEKYLACDSDETIWRGKAIPRGQLARLRQRTDVVNALHRRNRHAAYQRQIVLHVDSRQKGSRVDIFFYHHSESTAGRRTASQLQRTIEEKYRRHQPSRGYHGTVDARDRLYMLRKTLPRTVYIELGNIRNSQDQRRFVSVDNRQALANWLSEGLLKDRQNSRN